MRIVEVYKTLGIPESEWPEYKDADDFAKRIEFCGITKDIAFTSGSSSNDIRAKK